MSKPLLRALCWIRRDLRLYDHRPLMEACANATEVALVFVFDTSILGGLENRDDRRVTFIHKSLVELDQRLRKEHDSTLIVLYGDPAVCIPRLARELEADYVFAGRDYE
ncbi:MAG: deoxyribodipyrimidine photo-lyase, partial [Chlorobia bacterium]|nr:deoxyribodipyrimidine photo-lyase [Fimbriimonadaceae bacterium]